MKIGDLVKYKQQYETDDKGVLDGHRGSFGIIIDTQSLGARMLVEWNNGMRLWRHVNVLEVLCK